MGLRDKHGYQLFIYDTFGQIFIQLKIFTWQNITEHLLCASISLSTKSVVVKKEDRVFVLMEFLLLESLSLKKNIYIYIKHE